MLTLIRYTAVTIARSPGVLVWTLLFPLILSTIFSFMFSGIDEMAAEQTVTVAVVADERYEEAESFRAFLDEASDGQDGLLEVVTADSVQDARALVDDGTAAAYVTVAADGMPQMNVTATTNSRSQIDRSIVRALLDGYLQADASADILAEAAASGTAVDVARAQDAFAGDRTPTEEASILRVEPDGYSRYYYALIGMASLMGAGIALNVVSKTRANCSALGARRQASAASPARQLAAAIVASWLGTFACLLIAFAYVRFALDVEFGGRDALAVVALASCALLATGLGSLIGALPRVSIEAKDGINTALACVLSIGGGLYGEPTMQLADYLSANVPWIQAVNPAAQVSKVFYDLAYYDALAPFAATLATIGAMAAAFFLASGVLMRRQSYARL